MPISPASIETRCIVAFVQCVDRCQLSEGLYETFRKLLTSLPFTATAEGVVVLDYADKKPEPPPDFRGQPCSTSSACLFYPSLSTRRQERLHPHAG